MDPEGFPGFRTGSRATVIPNAFFTQLLPRLTDPAELLVSCYIFFALGRRGGFPRSVSGRALAAEPPLMRALARLPGGAEAALRRGLTQAVNRGTLLRRTGRSGDDSDLYLLNTEQTRRAVGEMPQAPVEDLDLEEYGAALQVTPGIYALYEENIGSIPPLLVDELREAEQVYPYTWLEAAFREAAARNRRNWRYISRILERWKLEGPDYEAPGGSAAPGSGTDRRSLAGPYRHLVHRAPDD